MVTSNLGLSVYDTASGSATTFLTFRLAVAGNSSNMSIIDAWAGAVSGSLVELQSNIVATVAATRISANYYECSVAGIDSYLTNSLINLQLDVTNTGAVTININSLGVITLKKIDVSGNLVDLASGDLKADRYTLFIYNGTNYVMIGTTTADQVSIAGTSGYLVSISASNVLADSGVSASSILSQITGSGIMSTTSGSVVKHNVSGITSASYDKVIVDSYGHVTAGSQIGFLSGISGSGIMSTTAGSVIKHNASGVVSGSYNQVSVDSYGHVTSASIVENGISYSGSALITISGSKISHTPSTAVSGNYLSANLTVDDYGHITAVASGASASSVGAPSDSPFVTFGSSVSLTNYNVLTAGSGVTVVSNPSASTITINSTATGSSDGWITPSGSWTFSSADAPSYVFSVPLDMTSTLSAGMKTKCSNSGSTVYGIITSVGAYTSGSTLITQYMGTDYAISASTTISNPRYSMSKAPLGFPMSPNKWSVTTTDTSNATQLVPISGSWYNLGSVNASIPIGVWNTNYQVALRFEDNAAQADIKVTLSTGNNTQSDSTWTSMFNNNVTGATNIIDIVSIYKSNVIEAASKTAYYLNAATSIASSIAINFRGDILATVIKAVCAYL